MIKTITDPKTNTTQYKVRVFLKSREHLGLRITRQKGGLRTLAEAKKEELRLKKECERELLLAESKGVLWGELVNDWQTHQYKMRVATGHRSIQTHEDNFNTLGKWFGEFAKRPTTDVNPYEVISRFEKMKEAGMSIGRRKKLKQLVKSVFDYGIQSGLLPTVQRSPTFEVILKRGEEKKPEILTLGEIQKLIHEAFKDNHPWRRIWTTALLTGMRSGELYALVWKDLDWENKLISVNKSYNCRFREVKSTKAGTWRQIPISRELEVILKEQQAETGNKEHVFPKHWTWHQGCQADVLRKFCFLKDLPSIRFHTLRACFATQMLRSGIETARVMKICGWKELKTMQHYVRLAGIEIQGATENFKIFGGHSMSGAPPGQPESEDPGKIHEGAVNAAPSFFAHSDASNLLASSHDVTVEGHTLDTRFYKPSKR